MDRDLCIGQEEGEKERRKGDILREGSVVWWWEDERENREGREMA